MAEMEKAILKVGGQAVMEGVMMRSPKSFAVAVRRTSGEIVLTESPWRSLWENFRFFRWPFLRGSVVLLESLINGISALNFSARVALADEEQAKKQEPKSSSENVDELSSKTSEVTLWLTVVLGLGLGVGLFVALPHLIVWLVGKSMGRELGVQDFMFHLIVGFVKLGVFLGYIALISTMKDVRRLFMYHGAEHQSIFAYEAGEALVVENARRYQPLHPRCGTTFLIMVIGISILVFSLAFPIILLWLEEPTSSGFLNQLIYIGIKLPLLFPIAGLAYEFQRLTSRYLDRWWARALAYPGMFVQRLTTRPPTDEQLEVALTSLKKALWREKFGAVTPSSAPEVKVYQNFQAVVDELGEA